MKKEEIRKEVIELGAENIAAQAGGEDRIDRWIQQAIREICDFKPWPFLFAEKEEAGPTIAVPDMGHLIAVVDLAVRNPLEFITLNQLLLGDPNLDGKGAAEYWYTEDGGKTIKVSPASTNRFRVDYRRVPLELADNEEPIFDADYHDVIVTRVRVQVYKATENLETAAEMLTDYERGRDAMVHALMKPNYDKERRLTRAGRRGDYL